MSNIPPQFQKFMEEFFSDKRDVLFPGANLLKVKIPLDAAFPDTSYAFQGDIIFCDRDSTGIAYVKLNSAGTAAFPFVRNTVVRGMPIKELIVSNPTPQPGLFINLWIGYGAEIIPPTLDIATISGTVSMVNAGQAYASKFTSSAAIAAAGTENVFAVASNTAGAIIQSVQDLGVNGTGMFSSESALHAHTAAPAAFTDGDMILNSDKFVQNSIASIFINTGQKEMPLSIVSAKGIWFRNNGGTNQTAGRRSVLYTFK